VKKAILGKKIGMTQVFAEDGNLIPVTVIQAGPCVVTQKKTIENEGYAAIQVGYQEMPSHKTKKPLKGHFAKAGVKPKKYLKEFRLEDAENYEIGQEINASVFNDGDIIDATSVSKGKGFQGPIKRHGFSRGPMSHGSKYHRGIGSLGASAGMSRVQKGKKMAGRMGGEKVTVQNLTVVKVDVEKNLILVKGAVPGAKGALVYLQDAVKGQV
jgi:large subunit ribosomal protein L3